VSHPDLAANYSRNDAGGGDLPYDTASRLLSLDNSTNSGHHEYEYTYDKVGNRTTMSVTDSGGTEMHVYSYDDIYQVTQVDYPAGYDPDLATDTTFHYDDAGNRTSVIDSGGTSSYVTNALNQYTAVGGITYDYDDNGNLTQDERFQYSYDPENRLTSATKLAGTPDPLTAACDTTLTFTTGGDANWFSQTATYHDGGDAAQSGDIADSEESWMETTVQGEGTLTFYWRVSSEVGDYLGFYIDGQYQTSVTGSSSWQQKSYNIVGLGTHTLLWKYYKDASGSGGSDCGWVDNVQWTAATKTPVAALAAAVDNANLAFITGGHANWGSTTYPVYYDGDSARSGYLGNNQFSEMQTTVSGSGTLTFYWKVSSEQNYDWLEVYLDGVRQDRISGEVAWTQKSISISGAGNHTLRWRYIKDGSTSSGDDRGYVDYLQWSGAGPIADPPSWETVSYTYDPAGRRIEKKVDGTTQVKYVYDGDHIIAEYNNAGTLLRKYVHGPCVDEPICMIEASGTYAGTHYYHYDALGSCVAMTNSAGNVTQLYEYSVYGQVAASDENHPNRFMFTGREFDKDTGLYYYRARYYNPEIGRFLQTDPIG
jgi:YD repeat-containing protein